MGLKFFGELCEHIIFQNVEAQSFSRTKSIWLKYRFHKLRLCMSNLESSRNDQSFLS